MPAVYCWLNPSTRPKLGISYQLPEYIETLVRTAVPAAGPPPPAAIIEVLQRTERDAQAFVQSHQAAITAALSRVSAATDAFTRQMDALEQKEIADHAARIDALFRGLIAAGHAHPEHQARILAASNQTGSFLSSLLRGAHAVLHSVTAAVGAAAGAAHNAAQTVSHWAAGASKTVGDFFKSVF